MKVELGLLTVLLFILAMSLYTKMNREVKNENETPSRVELSQENQSRINEIISNREEFLNQVTEEIRNAGFTYVTTGMVSKEGIQVNIILKEGEFVTEQMHEKVQKIYEEMLIKFDLAPEIFKIHVGQADKISRGDVSKPYESAAYSFNGFKAFDSSMKINAS